MAACCVADKHVVLDVFPPLSCVFPRCGCSLCARKTTVTKRPFIQPEIKAINNDLRFSEFQAVAPRMCILCDNRKANKSVFVEDNRQNVSG